MNTDDSDRSELEAIAAQLRGHLERLVDRGVTAVPLSQAGITPIFEEAAPDVPASRLTLGQIRDELGDCRRCKLAPTRKNIVFGVGNPHADLVFIGEAPGGNEDAQGEPFVGDAGKLLDKMINAMGWRRQDVYIANTLKCRPPGNRNPEPDETAQCEPFLIKQLEAIKPRLIVGLGKFAAQFLCKKPDAPISALRGKFHEYQGIKVMPTYHPAYLLRTPSAKRQVWEDLQLVMAELERLGVRPPAQAAS
jgi:DNA polymerase